jgi:hypothetical protein
MKGFISCPVLPRFRTMKVDKVITLRESEINAQFFFENKKQLTFSKQPIPLKKKKKKKSKPYG